VSRLKGISFIVVSALLSSAVLAAENLKFSAAVGLEYDDNITVPTVNQTTGESDVSAIFDFSASYTPIKVDGDELELTYDFYQSLHETFDEFDLQIHTLSAFGSHELGDYDLGLSYAYSMVYLGASEFYNSHTLTPSVGFSGAESWYHVVGYAYEDRDYDSSYPGRDAEQNSLSSDNFYFFMDNQAHFIFRLRMEEEDANDRELDYENTLIKIGVSLPLSDTDAKLKASYQRYWRDYDNITASIGEKREDEQDIISIDLIKPFNRSMSMKFSYEYTNADSNLPSADYDGNIVSASILVDF